MAVSSNSASSYQEYTSLTSATSSDVDGSSDCESERDLFSVQSLGLSGTGRSKLLTKPSSISGYTCSGSESDSDAESESDQAAAQHTPEPEVDELSPPPDQTSLRAASRHLVFKFTEHLKQDAAVFKEETKEQAEVVIQLLSEMYDLQEEEEEASEESAELRQDLDTPFSLQEVWFDRLRMAKLRHSVVGNSEKDEALGLKETGNNLLLNALFEDAVTHYNRAQKIDPRNPVIYCNRAAAYIKLWKPWSAVSDCASALMLDPKYIKAIGRLGCAYARLGHVALSQQCYEKASEMDPDNGSYRDALDVINRHLKDGENPSQDAESIARSIAAISGLVNLACEEKEGGRTPHEQYRPQSTSGGASIDFLERILSMVTSAGGQGAAQ